MARWGGEEFACILPDTEKDGALALAEKLRKAIIDKEMPHEASEVHSVVTVSIGVATIIPSEEDAAEDLLKQADEALYRAKELGRNRVFSK